TITVPIWIFIILVLFSAWSILSRMLIPSVRWYFRRRINRVIDEIASHLDLELRPFQLTKRQVLIDRLTFDPSVMEAIQEISKEKDIPLDVLQAEVNVYAREIVPSFNAYIYFRLGYWLARKFARLIYKVRVDRIDNEKLATVEKDSTVVFVMNHRSNMDYVLVAFLAMERTSLSYAVGEWARIWPLESLIKSMGAFFVRRKSGNPLYRLVLERYINMATREGVCQAVFLEGGLSKDGHLRTPKFGLIDYMLRYYNSGSDRDVVFIPVGLNYDRTVEDR
ncbi:MAG: glycerol-3-phosphate acyltransferase, partial [Proteobacteria bacterium]|nr:glycerol-3-phosphate acyltransferase [Pseudomonadota bacterium]